MRSQVGLPARGATAVTLCREPTCIACLHARISMSATCVRVVIGIVKYSFVSAVLLDNLLNVVFSFIILASGD